MKNIEKYKSKLLALRSVVDDLLKEMEEEQPSPPKQRQNKRDARVLHFKTMYDRLELKKQARRIRNNIPPNI